jgi:hypothetical protein
MSYVGTQPVPRATRVRTFGALATATNTIAIPGGFSPSNIEVFIDGLYVQPTDYNDLDGFNLVFITTLVIDTEYVVMEARNFEVANHYTKQEIQDASFDFNTMPTVGGDPVVENGSNADGEYTKFADGTQVCTIYEIVTNQAISGVYGSLYQGTRLWTFPQVFTTAPAGNCGFGEWGTSASWGSLSGLTASSLTARFYDIDSRSAGTAFDFSASAIGRWK